MELKEVSFDPMTGIEKLYESGISAVLDGFNSGSISRCCQGLQKSHKGLSGDMRSERANREVPDEWEAA